jgi:hypothetical protein
MSGYYYTSTSTSSSYTYSYDDHEWKHIDDLPNKGRKIQLRKKEEKQLKKKKPKEKTIQKKVYFDTELLWL